MLTVNNVIHLFIDNFVLYLFFAVFFVFCYFVLPIAIKTLWHGENKDAK